MEDTGRNKIDELFACCNVNATQAGRLGVCKSYVVFGMRLKFTCVNALVYSM